jgi:hypothetical protein
MQLYTVHVHLETALHVSGVTSTHHQGRMQLYLQHLVFVITLLLSSAIVEVLERSSNTSTKFEMFTMAKIWFPCNLVYICLHFEDNLLPPLSV